MIFHRITKITFTASAGQVVLKPLARRLVLSPLKITVRYVLSNALLDEALCVRRQKVLIWELRLLHAIPTTKKEISVVVLAVLVELKAHVLAPIVLQEMLREVPVNGVPALKAPPVALSDQACLQHQQKLLRNQAAAPFWDSVEIARAF